MRFKISPTILFLLWFCCLTSCREEKVRLDASDPQLHLKNGQLFYKDDLFSGQLSASYADGSQQSLVQYNKGRKEGEEKQWYPDGTLAISRSYSEGHKVGIHKAWWPNGNLKFEYHFNNNGQYNGRVTEWYSSGQKFMAFNYVNGKESGSQKLWQEDGRIKANYVVQNGERFGLIGLKKCNPVEAKNDEIN